MKENLQAKIEIKEILDMSVAYVRNIGSYKGDMQLFEQLFGKLFNWAVPRKLLNFPDTKCIAVYHDCPRHH